MHPLIRFVATYFIVIPVVAAIWLAWRLRGRQRIECVLMLIVGGGIAWLLAKLGSHMYNDPRPFVQGHFKPLIGHARDNGFPSDHMLLASLLGWLVLVYNRKAGLALLVVAALIGAARMAAGVHHLSDIIASMVFAGIGCWLSYLLVRRFYTDKRKTPLPSDKGV